MITWMIFNRFGELISFLQGRKNDAAVKFLSILNPKFGFPAMLPNLLLEAFEESGVPPESDIRYLVSRIAEAQQAKHMGKSEPTQVV